MRDIYTFSSQTVVWLGDGDWFTDWVFDSIQALPEIALPMDHRTLRPGVLRIINIAYLIPYLFDRPWFSRMWTCQEEAVPKTDPLVICGYKLISWTKPFDICF